MIKGLYIHIPFCENICYYCDFVKYKASESLHISYTEALLQELLNSKDDLSNVETVYIGGGTPSHIDRKLLEKLLITITSLINIDTLKEFSIESNPKDIDEEFIALLQKYKVSRLSIGVQTFNDRLLKLIGRNHQSHDVFSAIDLLRKNHYENFNLDFIYAIPTETLDEVRFDLEKIIEMNPTHISYYSLILEERTKLYYDVMHHHLKLADEDLEMDMALLIEDTLEKSGYHRYEFSNYAKPRFESKHNLIYWNLDDYLGIGLGASSLVNGERFTNVNHLKDYFTKINETGHGGRILEETDLPYEFLLMGLRKSSGINLQEFNNRFGIDLFESFPAVRKYINLGILESDAIELRFTKMGKYVSNQFYQELR